MKDSGIESRFKEFPQSALVWKLPTFVEDPLDLEDQTRKVKSFPYVILDLRGNRGGRVDSLDHFLGRFFARDVMAGEFKDRKHSAPVRIKGHQSPAADAKLIVLIDSKSASAVEIFARIIQLEKRGIVLGDRSSGMVMESERVVHAVQVTPVNVTQYGATITIADLIMSDGKRLEGVGVEPDERVVPTPQDLQAGRDPVLARALAIAGAQIDAQQAGALFPFEWPPLPPAMN